MTNQLISIDLTPGEADVDASKCRKAAEAFGQVPGLESRSGRAQCLPLFLETLSDCFSSGGMREANKP